MLETGDMYMGSPGLLCSFHSWILRLSESGLVTREVHCSIASHCRNKFSLLLRRGIHSGCHFLCAGRDIWTSDGLDGTLVHFDILHVQQIIDMLCPQPAVRHAQAGACLEHGMLCRDLTASVDAAAISGCWPTLQWLLETYPATLWDYGKACW